MRRRRTNGTWFPLLGTTTGDTQGFNFSGRTFGFTLPDDGNATVLITPVIPDQPIEGEAANFTLNDFIGNEYILQRIVGKIFANRNVVLTESGAAGQIDPGIPVLFGAGFFVARAQDADSGDPAQPIGSNSPEERNDNYNPLDVDCIREPWIWRRTWLLGSLGAWPLNNTSNVTEEFFGGTSLENFRQAAFYPPSTAAYGSVMDGPHIDSKVKRRIRLDERLWFAIAATPFPFHSPLDSNLAIQGILDLRVFGSLRKARGTSSF